MRTTCLVNNYNYASYVKDAIESAIFQSRPFDEIIVVDDCSTDNSRHVIEEIAAKYKNLKCIFKKKNGGQLSCLNEAYYIVTGDVVFFLDSDDRYKPNYLEQVMRLYEEKNEIDYVFTDFETIGKSPLWDEKMGERDYYVPCSILVTAFAYLYLGGRTSVISMKKDILDKILPYPWEEDWRISADNCLVWGASLVGASKYYMAQKLVEYRVHDSNNWHGKKKDNKSRLKLNIAVNRFFKFFKSKMWISEDMLKKAYWEFRLMPDLKLIPTKILKSYVTMILRSELPIKDKCKNLIQIYLEYSYRLLKRLWK